jgi:hypothetical protein
MLAHMSNMNLLLPTMCRIPFPSKIGRLRQMAPAEYKLLSFEF